MAPSRPFYPTVAALGSVLLFSTGGLCIKIIPLSALTISGLRSLLAVFFFLVLLAGRGSLTSAIRLGRLGWVIAVSYAMVVTLFVAATKLTTAANAIFLQYTMPAWVLIGGALWLHERVTFGRFASIFCCLVGMALFFRGELNPSDWQGNSIALLAGFFFAVMTLCIRLERDHQPLGAVFMGNLITAATSLPLAAWYFPHDFSSLHDTRVWLGLFLLGFFSDGPGLYLFPLRPKGTPRHRGGHSLPAGADPQSHARLFQHRRNPGDLGHRRGDHYSLLRLDSPFLCGRRILRARTGAFVEYPTHGKLDAYRSI